MERPRFLKETDTRLANIDRRLTSSGATSDIEIMGVAHDWSPGKKLSTKVNGADVVTLELSRGVVRAGLEKADSNILANNRFWSILLTGLRETITGKSVKGIEVNQTPRVALKRLSLHHNVATLAPSLYTLEINPGTDINLSGMLQPDEVVLFNKFKWHISDAPDTVLFVDDLLSKALEDEGKKHELPLELCDGVLLVCVNDNVIKVKQPKTTFIAPPHSSLDETKDQVRNKLSNAPIRLTEQELDQIAMNTLITYLLTPAEITEAEEIAYTTNQYLRRGLKEEQKHIHTLHVGGAFHAQTISDVLKESMPEGCSRINISTSYDPRMGAPYIADLLTFFRDHITLIDRMNSVSVTGFETTVNPQQISTQVDSAIDTNSEDFEKRVVIQRILEKKYPDQKGYRNFRNTYRGRVILDRISLKELKNMLPADEA